MRESAANDARPGRAVMLSEHTRFGGETGAGVMRNRCAFTSRDMGAGWAESFTYAVVLGWDVDDPDDDDPHGAMREQAAKWGWDDDMVAFLRDAHERFKQLADRAEQDTPRRQLRWWRPGGLRWSWLARRTNGRFGLGRWTQGEVDRINASAAELARTLPTDERTNDA